MHKNMTFKNSQEANPKGVLYLLGRLLALRSSGRGAWTALAELPLQGAVATRRDQTCKSQFKMPQISKNCY